MIRRKFLKAALSTLTIPLLGFKRPKAGIELIIDEVRTLYLGRVIAPGYKFQTIINGERVSCLYGALYYNNFGWLGQEGISRENVNAMCEKYGVTMEQLACLMWGFALVKNNRVETSEYKAGAALRNELNNKGIKYVDYKGLKYVY